jgi:DNA invertase Pin-like site-specific DNA recombinase
MSQEDRLVQDTIRHQEKLAEGIRRRLRAIIYCRVSTDKQEIDGESLDYQEAKCRSYAELHDIEVIAVLREAKSGYIHYSLREKLTLARQLVRDGVADMIIVFDLRRFSRNFVHSAMIFEEIESAGAEIVSVSENIDNSLTGKLIRSILAWSAESERHKIVEYANRRWQTRVELGLPVGTGRAPYGWSWEDKDKTSYVVNAEEAAVRVSIFHMFVELDMSLRAIMHKLTEDRILTPTYAKRFQDEPPADGEIKLEYCLWRYTTIREILKDLENIGILVVCKTKQKIGPDGKRKSETHPNRKEVVDGIPAIINPNIYARAQEKLETNKADKSHLPLNKEDYLLRGHISCAACGCSMKPRTQKKGRLTKKGTDKSYPFYCCTNRLNRYNTCPTLTNIRTSPLDEIVWQECCVLFKRIDALQMALKQEMEAAINALLEDTTGQEQLRKIGATIAMGKFEREKYPEGSYMYNLITEDILKQEEQLARFQEEIGSSATESAVSAYQQRIMDFLEFLNVMHGRYEHASFQEKRNALEVLGVQVVVHAPSSDVYGLDQELLAIADGQEWFSAKEAGKLLGVHPKTIRFYQKNGTITNFKEEPYLFIHRDEVMKLQQRGFLQRNTEEIVRGRVEISYSPRFNGRGINLTADPLSLHTRKYV